MKRALELGCELHNHSWSHAHVASFTEAEIRDEIARTTAAIERAVGVSPAFFRPPYLETSEALFRASGFPAIGGICCNDWLDEVSAETRAATILRDVRDGTVILMHDMEGNFRTVDALDILVPALLAEGYRFVVMSALFRERGIDPAVPGRIWHRAEL
jgi:peptidoglycan/xylan/chitin deacetylase (PgdA/CDA1 family)